MNRATKQSLTATKCAAETFLASGEGRNTNKTSPQISVDLPHEDSSLTASLSLYDRKMVTIFLST